MMKNKTIIICGVILFILLVVSSSIFFKYKNSNNLNINDKNIVVEEENSTNDNIIIEEDENNNNNENITGEENISTDIITDEEENNNHPPHISSLDFNISEDFTITDDFMFRENYSEISIYTNTNDDIIEIYKITDSKTKKHISKSYKKCKILDKNYNTKSNISGILYEDSEYNHYIFSFNDNDTQYEISSNSKDILLSFIDTITIK